MFYRIDKENNIIDSAEFKYADDCLESDKKIVRGFNGKLVFEEETLTSEYKLAEEKAKTELINHQKLTNLRNWFNEYYQQHEQKYRRLHTMKKLCDDGSSPLEKLYDLYDEAEEKRKEIQRLEQGVEENGTLYDNTL